MSNYTLPPEVKDLLRRRTATADSITLPPGQLDRPLYEAVNKALDFIGGRWNRSRRCHVFATDPRPKLEAILDAGVAVDEQKKYQAFYTPPALAAEVADLADVAGKAVLEPSAGHGALVKAALAAGAVRVDAIDLNPENEAPLRGTTSEVFIFDFLKFPTGLPYERIVMNPPFTRGQDVQHVRHALKFLSPGGILVAIMLDGYHRSVWQEFETDLLGCRELGVTYTTQRVPRGTFDDTDVATIILRVVFDPATLDAATVTGRFHEILGDTTTKNESNNDMKKTKLDKLPRGGLAAEALRAQAAAEPVLSEPVLAVEADAAAAPEPEPKPAAPRKTPKKNVKNVVAKKAKAVRATGGSTGKRMPKIMDFSVCAVVRALGAAGVQNGHAKAILAAHGINDMPPASLSVQLGFGRNGTEGRKPAPLTTEQLNELTASAADPDAVAA